MKNEKKQTPEQDELPKRDMFGFPITDEYIGNMWGWKISYIGLGLIVVLGGLMLYRHYQLDDWRLTVDPEPTEQTITE